MLVIIRSRKASRSRRKQKFARKRGICKELKNKSMSLEELAIAFEPFYSRIILEAIVDGLVADGLVDEKRSKGQIVFELNDAGHLFLKTGIDRPLKPWERRFFDSGKA